MSFNVTNNQLPTALRFGNKQKPQQNAPTNTKGQDTKSNQTDETKADNMAGPGCCFDIGDGGCMPF